MLSKIQNQYDVIIVGGGINGVGIARDCALRGIKCLLIEKNDFSAGTSGASSGMIHGGPRYMLNDVNVTKLSCLDSGYIQKIAPHLLFRIPFLYTVYKTPKRSGLISKALLEGVESFFRAYDSFVPLKNGKKHSRLSAEECVALEPNLPSQDLVGGVTFDEWGIDVPRLCIANVIDAYENGAHFLNHTEVTQVIREADQVKGVVIKDLIEGTSKTVSCRYLVNATGPWSPNFAKQFGAKIKLRVSKGIHIAFDRRLFNIALVSQAIDGREIFFLPYENASILGTTDDDFFGDLDNQKCTEDEIKYLLEGIEQVFPAVKEAKMIDTISGVRPTLYEKNCYEDQLSREHELIDHEKSDQIKGVISLIGGKLASYRIISKEVADLLAKKLGVESESITHAKPLPGGDSIPNIQELANTYQLDPYIVARLVYRHGSRAEHVLENIKKDPKLSVPICSCEPVIEAELKYAVEHEFARTLSDVRRRTRLTQGPCQGTNCLQASSSVLASLQGKSPKEHSDMTKDFMREWWWNRACVLNANQFKQEELFQAIHFCNNSLDVV